MTGKFPLNRWSEKDLQEKSRSVPWKAASHGCKKSIQGHTKKNLISWRTEKVCVSKTEPTQRRPAGGRKGWP